MVVNSRNDSITEKQIENKKVMEKELTLSFYDTNEIIRIDKKDFKVIDRIIHEKRLYYYIENLDDFTKKFIVYELIKEKKICEFNNVTNKTLIQNLKKEYGINVSYRIGRTLLKLLVLNLSTLLVVLILTIIKDIVMFNPVYILIVAIVSLLPYTNIKLLFNSHAYTYREKKIKINDSIFFTVLTLILSYIIMLYLFFEYKHYIFQISQTIWDFLYAFFCNLSSWINSQLELIFKKLFQS